MSTPRSARDIHWPVVWALALGLILPPVFRRVYPGTMRSSRLPLTSTFLAKAQYDEFLAQGDKSVWYRVDMERLASSELADQFVQSHCDEDTQAFIQRSIDKSDWFFTQLWHSLAKGVLSWFYTQTDVNGLLDRGSMFVLSTEQLLSLIELDRMQPRARMIDLGAGDGCPTRAFMPFFSQTLATEASRPMRQLLSHKGIQVLEIDAWAQDGSQYDLVACLNLLDRCEEPRQILAQISSALKPDGHAVVAVVLPFTPYVEYTTDHKPKERLPLTPKATFEQQIVEFAAIFAEAGLEVVRWTKVPYLCEGDLSKSVYSLSDAIFVLKLQ